MYIHVASVLFWQLLSFPAPLDQWYKSTINLPSCQRPCTPSDPLICCDAVWLPNLDLPTNLAYSQDRYVKGKFYIQYFVQCNMYYVLCMHLCPRTLLTLTTDMSKVGSMYSTSLLSYVLCCVQCEVQSYVRISAFQALWDLCLSCNSSACVFRSYGACKPFLTVPYVNCTVRILSLCWTLLPLL